MAKEWTPEEIAYFTWMRARLAEDGEVGSAIRAEIESFLEQNKLLRAVYKPPEFQGKIQSAILCGKSGSGAVEGFEKIRLREVELNSYGVFAQGLIREHSFLEQRNFYAVEGGGRDIFYVVKYFLAPNKKLDMWKMRT